MGDSGSAATPRGAGAYAEGDILRDPVSGAAFVLKPYSLRREVVYHLVFEVEIKGTGVCSDPDITHVDTEDEAGAVVADALKRAQSWEWVSVRRREVPASARAEGRASEGGG